MQRPGWVGPACWGLGSCAPGTCWGPGYRGARPPRPRSLNSKRSGQENHRGTLGCHQAAEARGGREPSGRSWVRGGPSGWSWRELRDRRQSGQDGSLLGLWLRVAVALMPPFVQTTPRRGVQATGVAAEPGGWDPGSQGRERTGLGGGGLGDVVRAMAVSGRASCVPPPQPPQLRLVTREGGCVSPKER